MASIPFLSKRFSNFRDYYAYKAKCINFMTNSLFGRFIRFKTDNNTFTITPYPSFIKTLRNCIKPSHRHGLLSNRGDAYDHSKYNSLIDVKMQQVNVMTKVFDELQLTNDLKILDIGCGSGWYVNRFREIGWENVAGVEPSTVSAEYAQHNFSAHVYHEYFGTGQHMESNPDICIFIGSIDRIPYNVGIAPLKHLNPRLVVIFTSTYIENLPRDWHLEFSKHGYHCFKKATYLANENNKRLEEVREILHENIDSYMDFFAFTRIGQ